MPTPTDISALEPWEVYIEDASWPAATDHRFIVAAAAEMGWIKFEMTPRDIGLDHEFPARRNEIAAAMAELLMRGSLVASVRPFGGGRLLPLSEAEWTPESATAAIATGFVRRRHRSQRSHPHHVFIGVAETTMMARVYTVTDMLVPREDQGTPEELAGIVLANLSAIAGNKVALAPEGSARRVLELVLPSLKPKLDDDDQEKLIAAAATWLIRRLNDDLKQGSGLLRDDFRDEALEQFGPFMTPRIFEKLWRRVILSNKKTHGGRSDPGRRSGKNISRSGGGELPSG